MKIIPIIYTVRGTGRFPIDMLREDGSSPYSNRDSWRIEMTRRMPGSEEQKYQITLIKHNAHKFNHAIEHNWTPNSTKWKSFGWEVISVEEKRT